MDLFWQDRYPQIPVPMKSLQFLLLLVVAFFSSKVAFAQACQVDRDCGVLNSGLICNIAQGQQAGQCANGCRGAANQQNTFNTCKVGETCSSNNTVVGTCSASDAGTDGGTTDASTDAASDTGVSDTGVEDAASDTGARDASSDARVDSGTLVDAGFCDTDILALEGGGCSSRSTSYGSDFGMLTGFVALAFGLTRARRRR